MTAPTPLSSHKALARPRRYGVPNFVSEQGDRVFLTLLSLNFMLLAFFVVLGTTASVDRGRADKVRNSVHVAFAPEPVRDHIAHLSVSQALQARVSDRFGGILPSGSSPVLRNEDRVDIDMPLTVLSERGLSDIVD